MMKIRKKRVAIIGAGISGILSIKSCLEEKEEFSEIVCFEKTNSPGGLWFFREEDNDQDQDKNKQDNNKQDEQDNNQDEDQDKITTVMAGTVANSSKEMSSFSDFPPNSNLPNYLPHEKMLSYILSYAKNFDCLKYIKYQQQVICVSRLPSWNNWNWKLKVKDNSSRSNLNLSSRSNLSSSSRSNLDSRSNSVYEEYFDLVMVCTGHHGRPFLPRFNGQEHFKGKIIHTQEYKRPDKFSRQNVLIVGAGNSGLDSAVELSSTCNQVYLSTRSGCWILPRLGFRGGRPYDISFLSRSMHYLKDLLPSSIVSYVIETLLNRRFDHDLYQIRPSHPLFYEHPTVNDLLPAKIISGQVKVKGQVKKLTQNGVIFEGNKKYIENGIDTSAKIPSRDSNQNCIENAIDTSAMISSSGEDFDSSDFDFLGNLKNKSQDGDSYHDYKDKNQDKYQDNGEDKDEDEEIKIDTIICATGYHLDYPFLEHNLRLKIMNSGKDNSVNLYKYIFPLLDNLSPVSDKITISDTITGDKTISDTCHDKVISNTCSGDNFTCSGDTFTGLGFIGVPNALGPLFPISEIQSRWFVQVATGKCHLPSLPDMIEDIEKQDKQRKRKFTETPRHGVQVEWIPYLDEIASQFGAKPDLVTMFFNDPKLWFKLYFGPSLPYQYRLIGPHTWTGARGAILTADQRIEKPFLTSSRIINPDQDQVSTNPRYQDHGFVYKIIFAVIGAFFMDMIFFWG